MPASKRTSEPPGLVYRSAAQNSRSDGLSRLQASVTTNMTAMLSPNVALTRLAHSQRIGSTPLPIHAPGTSNGSVAKPGAALQGRQRAIGPLEGTTARARIAPGGLPCRPFRAFQIVAFGPCRKIKCGVLLETD